MALGVFTEAVSEYLNGCVCGNVRSLYRRVSVTACFFDLASHVSSRIVHRLVLRMTVHLGQSIDAADHWDRPFPRLVV